jgi:hypothetical protein
VSADTGEWTGQPSREAPSRLPLILITLTLVLALGYNSFYLLRERRNLRTIRENQQASLRQADRVRAQFESIVKRMIQLSQEGHPGAKAIVEQLARRGVTIRPDAPERQPGPPPATK